MQKREIHVTKKETVAKFSLIGLSLIFYILALLYLPFILDTYFKFIPIRANIGIDKNYIYIGIKLVVILFGSFIPFLIIKRVMNVSFSSFFKTTKIKFHELIYHTIILIAICSLLMFTMTIVNEFFPIYGSLLYPIGLTQGEEFLSNYIYIFLFVFVTPFIEEVIFRGILLRSLGRYGNYFAIITISIIYGLCNQSIGEIILAFVLSFYLIRITLRHKSIQPAIFIHILFNAFFIGLQYIPAANYYITTGAFIFIYLISIFIILTGKLEPIKIKRNPSFQYVMSLFFSRLTIIIAVLLSIVYPVVKNIIIKL
ncbi:MAG: type II CAAX endopeptidase family protein [Erysipelotrichaceae bacterium]|nr:type II CAAX endopeptidase family protein [Erysipelotrichaceae bacterium]